MSQGHAFLPPSSAHRWVVCPASAALEAAYPETEQSPEALEGEAAHWVNQMRLAGTPPLEGKQAPNGVAVTREMLEAAELVATTIGDLPIIVEQRVNMPRIHPSHNWGTPDYRAWVGNELYLADFKYGHGIVDAFENWQMIDYVNGCFEEAGVDGMRDQQIVVHMCIIQPRAFHRDGPVRWWHIKASDLRAYFNRLANAAGEATGPNPTATPTPDGCKHCRGRHACVALQRAAYGAADMGGKWGSMELPPAAAGLELRMLRRAAKQLDARITGLEAQVVAYIKTGKPVPFWILDSVPGRLEWQRPAAEVFMLGDLMGVDLRKPAEPITPTQAKAAAKAAKLPDGLFDGYSGRPAGAAKLTEDTGSKAALTFGQTLL